MHHYYPRCAIGASGDRLEWLGVVRPERLAVARALSDEFESIVARHRDRLLDARAVLAADPLDIRAQRKLDGLLREFLDRADTFLESHAGRLEKIGLTAADMSRLIEEWSETWAGSSPDERPEFDASAPVGFTPSRPGAVACEEEKGASEELYDDGRLRITCELAGFRLRFQGEIDGSNLEAVEASLRRLVGGDQALHVDFAAVTFCDLDGFRALVRASSDRPIVLTGMTPGLERAVGLAGWAQLPNLHWSAASRDTGVTVGA